MKKYTEEELRSSPKTLLKFLFKRIDNDDSLVPDEAMLNDAVFYYIKNTTSKKPKKSRAEIRRSLTKEYFTLINNNIIN